MILKIDMHVHTCYSDSVGSVEEAMQTARRRGLDGIAITDHNTIEGVYEALKKRYDDLVIVPGEEVETDRGEILALGIRECIPRKISILEALRRTHAQRGLVIIPHPTIPLFSKLKEEDMRNLQIDGLEVFSSATPLSKYYLKKNLELARRLRLPITAGSDSHFPETVGDAHTIVHSENLTIESILRAVKSGNTAVAGSPSGLAVKLRFCAEASAGSLRKALNLEREKASRKASVAQHRIVSKDKDAHFF